MIFSHAMLQVIEFEHHEKSITYETSCVDSRHRDLVSKPSIVGILVLILRVGMSMGMGMGSLGSGR